MAYLTLSQDDQDDVLVAFMHSQENDSYSHTVNQQRYREMLRTLPDGAFKIRIQELLNQTNARLAEVTSIIENTTPQMPPQARIAAALARLKLAGKI